MKRKKAKRGSGAKKPPIPVRSLRALGKRTLETVPDWHRVGFFRQLLGGAPATDREEIAGVPLPTDLEPAVRYYAGRAFESLDKRIGETPWYGLSEEEYLERKADFSHWREAYLNPEDWHEIRQGLERCFRQGFYLALLRYADDLKQSAEATAFLEGLKKGRKKGTATTKRKAEPRRMAVRRRFRALRKSGFNKGDAREEIQQEYRLRGEEISVRQLERYTEGLS